MYCFPYTQLLNFVMITKLFGVWGHIPAAEKYVIDVARPVTMHHVRTPCFTMLGWDESALANNYLQLRAIALIHFSCPNSLHSARVVLNDYCMPCTRHVLDLYCPNSMLQSDFDKLSQQQKGPIEAWPTDSPNQGCLQDCIFWTADQWHACSDVWGQKLSIKGIDTCVQITVDSGSRP